MKSLYTDTVNLVSARGKLTNKNVIKLPNEWTDEKPCVDVNSITVCLTPIGAHQDIIVKRVSLEEVVLQAKPGMPVSCYYHVFGELEEVSQGS